MGYKAAERSIPQQNGQEELRLAMAKGNPQMRDEYVVRAEI